MQCKVLQCNLTPTKHSLDQVPRPIQPKHAQILPRLQLLNSTRVLQECHRSAVEGQQALKVLVIPADAQVMMSDDLAFGGL